MQPEPSPFEIESIRPLVRYVDRERAVIELHVSVRNSSEMSDSSESIDVCIQLTGPDGEIIEERATLNLTQSTSVIRFDVLAPHRWWPAGMGDQSLYDVVVNFFADDAAIARWTSTMGLTSVRPGNSGVTHFFKDQGTLLVNSRECTIQSIVMVEPDDEDHVLPVAGDSLLVVANHYGPDRLYEAADRAGILLLQSIVLSNNNQLPQLQDQVDRLAGHPSLAGWMVAPRGIVTDRLAHRVRQLDPTRSVFRMLKDEG